MSGPIIITMPKYLGGSNPRGILDGAMENASVIANSQAKKRRLDHLSWEEKVQRKKLKNRVAAQTSRDRKKARMDELQDEVSSLKSEIERLRLQNQRLTVENTDLKQKLTCPDKTRPSSCVGCEALLGSAVSLLPLPQEGLSQPAPLEGDRKTDLLEVINSDECLESIAQSLLSGDAFEENFKDLPTDVSPLPECSPKASIASEVSSYVGESPQHMEYSNDGSQSQLDHVYSALEFTNNEHNIEPTNTLLKPEIKTNKSSDTIEAIEEDYNTNTSECSDSLFGTYDESTNSITIVYPDEDTPISERVEEVHTGNTFSSSHNEYLLPEMLSPIQNSLSPCPSDISTEYCNSLVTNNWSDCGYESHSSPLSVLSTSSADYWDDQLTELFPALL